MRFANRIASIILIVLSIAVTIQALQWKYMENGTPGPGFLPVWISIGMVIVSTILVIKSFTRFASTLPNPFAKGDFREFFIVIGGGFGAMALSQVTGLLIALGLMTGIISRLLGTKNWKTIVGLTIGVPVVLFVIFDVVLGVPLPQGLLDLRG